MRTVRIVCKGKVQGVFYRASTKEKADELGIHGWVKNLSNGDVEVLATGMESQLDALIKWCWQGPPASNVENVLVNEEEKLEQFNDFKVRYF